MEVTRRFDNFSDAFYLLNQLLKGCDTPYTFPPCDNVKEFCQSYVATQFERSLSFSGFSYINYDLEIDEYMVKFYYCSTSNTEIFAQFDTGIWEDDDHGYTVSVKLPKNRCTKSGTHYNSLTEILFGDWDGWLNHETGRMKKPAEMKGFPVPEWVLKKRSNFVFWNCGYDALEIASLFSKRDFFKTDTFGLLSHFYMRGDYRIIIQPQGYSPSFICLLPDETLQEGCMFGSLLEVLQWIYDKEKKLLDKMNWIESEIEAWQDYENCDFDGDYGY